MVQDPKDYAWSSYAFYAYGRASELLTVNPLFETLGKTDEERQQAYREYLITPRSYEAIVDRFFEERVLV